MAVKSSNVYLLFRVNHSKYNRLYYMLYAISTNFYVYCQNCVCIITIILSCYHPYIIRMSVIMKTKVPPWEGKPPP